MVAAIFFSPTHTTRTLVRRVAQTLTEEYREWDLTFGQKEKFPSFGKEDLCIVGAPVYSGRIPKQEREQLKKLVGNDTPCLLLVVYGNRAYDDALLELSDLLTSCGFRPIGAGAFIGEHSLVREVGKDRPDAADLQAATRFAREAIETAREKKETLVLPGNRPYVESSHGAEPWAPHPTQDCVSCGMCAQVCPVGIIAQLAPFVVTQATQCLHCCACVKSCPVAARVADAPPAKEIAQFLRDTCQERKEPEWFIQKG